VADVVSLKYRVFLSYAHADASWAKWLHGRLESFRFDKELIGRKTSLGTVPKTLRPIFRDREEFSGGHGLTTATIAALVLGDMRSRRLRGIAPSRTNQFINRRDRATFAARG